MTCSGEMDLILVMRIAYASITIILRLVLILIVVFKLKRIRKENKRTNLISTSVYYFTVVSALFSILAGTFDLPYLLYFQSHNQVC